MIYDQLIALIETHKQHLADSVIEQIDKHGQIKAPKEARTRNVLIWLDIMLTYLKEGDSQIWRDKITQLIERVTNYNFSINELLGFNDIIYRVIDQLIDQELPLEKDPNNAKLRQRFHRRIQGLSTSTSTVTRVVAMRTK